MATLAFLSALCPVAVGILVVSINPQRLTNQLFLVCALVISVAGLCIAGAYRGAVFYALYGTSDAVQWIRGNAVCGYFIPALLVMTRDSIRLPDADAAKVARNATPWFIVAAALSISALTEIFIPPESTHASPKRGPAYYVNTIIFIVMYIVFLLQTHSQARRLRGPQRLNLQSLVLTTALGIALFVSFALVGNALSIPALKLISVFITPVTFCITAILVFHHRIFNTKEVALSAMQHTLTLASCVIIGWFLFNILNYHLAAPGPELLALCFIAIFASPIDRVIRHGLSINKLYKLQNERRALIDLARTSNETSELIQRLEAKLQQSTQAAFVRIMQRHEDKFIWGRFSLRNDPTIIAAIHEFCWVTPEAIQRRSPSDSGIKLRQLMQDYSFGLLLTVPQGAQNPALLVAFGHKPNEAPFTYPEIERLHNLAELMDNLLVRSLLVEQAALQAKMEHLSMLSRGLAHDLKNLITPVSSFLVYSENKLSPGTVEAEVHTAARHAVKVMTEYVREAMFFAEKLEPRFESVDATRLCVASAEVVGARALARGVALKVETVRGGTLQADAVLIQRMLSNLAANAIDASPAGASVRLTVTTPTADRIAFHVIDQGTGIAPEHLHRVFDAYFTTKEFGDQTRGFGLGLTIAQKIAHLHGGTITVQSRLGQGTTMIVDLPTSQPDTAARTHARNEPATTPSA